MGGGAKFIYDKSKYRQRARNDKLWLATGGLGQLY
jgi:hypothetical protein